MSYPPPLYQGTTGELTVSYRPASQPADIVNTRTGNRVHYLATGQSTGRKFGLYRWEIGPGERGPDPHFHRTITESFHVLEGSVAIFSASDGSTRNPVTGSTCPKAASTASRTDPAARPQCC
jgi:uncharacterized cupin superfamily protein